MASVAAAAGAARAKPRSVLRFNQYDQVVQAALAGQGVALGRVPLVRDLLAQRRLVLASAQPPSECGYAIGCM
jgi:DNA-binding transcriptional LysR family regulator